MREFLLEPGVDIFQPRAGGCQSSLKQAIEKLLGIQDVETIRTTRGARD